MKELFQGITWCTRSILPYVYLPYITEADEHRYLFASLRLLAATKAGGLGHPNNT